MQAYLVISPLMVIQIIPTFFFTSLKQLSKKCARILCILVDWCFYRPHSQKNNCWDKESIFNKCWQRVFPHSLAIGTSPATYKRALVPTSIGAPCTDWMWTLRHSLALSVMFRCLSLAFKVLHNMNWSKHLGIIPPYCSVLQKPFTLPKVVTLFLNQNLSILIP